MQEILFLEARKSFVCKLFPNLISFNSNHFNIGFSIRRFCDSKNSREMEKSLRVIINKVKSTILFIFIVISTYILRIILFHTCTTVGVFWYLRRNGWKIDTYFTLMTV